MQKILVAMSGGVDSSVTAHLLKNQGFELLGVTLKLFSNEDIDVTDKSKTCCALTDVEDAKRVCDRIDIAHYTLNYRELFKEHVINRFVDSYRNGFTPNPCIDCNRYIKFKDLLLKAEMLECEYLATGHYAIVEYNSESKRYNLKKAKDITKDQSYVLYFLNQDQLSKTLFPLGSLTKNEVRDIATKSGFVNAKKPDSQDICFVTDGHYGDFIETYTGEQMREGNFVDTNGNVLGQHKGIMRYTIGQRKGLGMAFGKPMYVCGKSAQNNTVSIGEESELYSKTLIATDVNFIAIETLNSPMKVKAKTRYNMIEQDATISPLQSGNVYVEFDNPQKAITCGQTVVFYNDDVVIGGGTIQ